MHELYELKSMLCKKLEEYGRKGDITATMTVAAHTQEAGICEEGTALMREAEMRSVTAVAGIPGISGKWL